RYFHVTGVQTCALPISWTTDNQLIIQNKLYFIMADKESKNLLVGTPVAQSLAFMPIPLDSLIQFCSGYRLVEKGEEKEIQLSFRSEERRVGKESIARHT